MLLAITAALVLLYSLAVLMIWSNVRRTSAHLSSNIAFTWGSAILLHAILLNMTLFNQHGVDLSLFKSLSLSMLLLSLTLFILCFRQPLTMLGLIVLPLTVIALLLSYLNVDDPVFIKSANSIGIQIHIASSFLAYTFLNLATIQAAAIYIQDRKLKSSSLPAFVQTLLPLTAMESFLYSLLIIGTVFLTVSLASGWIYHENLFAQHLVHKTVLSMAAWLFFLSVLIGKTLFGWRGKNVWKTVLTGASLLILAYFGNKLVLELILDRV